MNRKITINGTTYHHGDAVTCTIAGSEITDAKISISPMYNPFICQNIRDGTRAVDLLGYQYSWVFSQCDPSMDDVRNLKLAHVTAKSLNKSWKRSPLKSQ